MYLGLCLAFVAVQAFSSFGEGRLPSVAELGLLTAVAPLAGAQSPGCMGFGSCGKWAQQWRFPGCRAQAQ